MSWVKGKTPPPARLVGGFAVGFGRVSGSVQDRRLAKSLNAQSGFVRSDRDTLGRRLLKFGKWHNPRKRDVPADNMQEGWLVATDFPPRPQEPEPLPEGQDGDQDQNPQDPQGPR